MSVKLIDWNKEIAADLGAKVLFSVLALPPHKDKVNAEIAAIELPGGIFIDVEFVACSNHYLVRLFKDDPDNPIATSVHPNATKVIDAVKDFAELTRVRAVSNKSVDGNTYIELKNSIDCDTSRASSKARTKIVKMEFA